MSVNCLEGGIMEVKLNKHSGCGNPECDPEAPSSNCATCGAFYVQEVMSPIMLEVFKGHYENVYWAEDNQVRFTVKGTDYKVIEEGDIFFCYVKMSSTLYKPTCIMYGATRFAMYLSSMKGGN
jgi:hypothetical protein